MKNDGKLLSESLTPIYKSYEYSKLTVICIDCTNITGLLFHHASTLLQKIIQLNNFINPEFKKS